MCRKIIAPIIIGILTIAALGAYIGFIMQLMPFLWLKIVIIAALVCLVGAMIYVTVDRIREIKKEDIDDVVSKY